ncbi:SnoaL-domain-containing protein [Hypoxylon rubiginosum]|uniref:SnoaL-domain-containing protein n=1 Tax=Hypoxylon rubiginosum TaxID=110542 RepID=A0ACB9ZCV7_9PEZI|nr:SnoaL-domain-containing protein [Hypoxylon rubiginosum]
MADIETVYRSFILCINERRWDDLPSYMHYDFIKNGQDYTPESYAAEMRSAAAASGAELTIDALTVDRESQRRLAATVLVRVRSANAEGDESAELPGRPVSFMEQHVNWFTEGKLSKTWILTDRDKVCRQFSDLEAGTYTPDLIGQEQQQQQQQPPPPPPPPEASSSSEDRVLLRLSSRELEDTYRAYIGCINAQSMETELHRFCHAQVVHNTRALTADGYRLLIREAFAAIPDIVFRLGAVVADDEAQRVAARIEFAGTPQGPSTLAGVKPNDNGGRVVVHFAEHVTYRFVDGKIARVWSIVDWASYRAQLLSE